RWGRARRALERPQPIAPSAPVDRPGRASRLRRATSAFRLRSMRVAILPSGAWFADAASSDDQARDGLSAAARVRVARAFARGPGHAPLDPGARHPSWHAVGKVCLHLAENRGDEEHPFAFLATYAARASAGGKVQHRPLARALEESSARGDRQALLHLLVPLQRAAEQTKWL